MGKKKWGTKVLLVILSFVASLLISELFIRIFLDTSGKITFKGDSVGSSHSFCVLSDDPLLVYELRTWPQPITKEKPKDTVRIIALGDSITFRNGKDLGDLYPGLLQNLFNKNHRPSDNFKYEVINSGIPGYNTIQEAEFLEKRLIRYSPDVIIVGYCAANDRMIARRLIRYKDGLYCSDVIRPDCPYLFDFPFNKFLLEKSALYRFVNRRLAFSIHRKNKNYKIKYFSVAGPKTEDAIKRIKEIAAKNSSRLLFVIFPLLDDEGSESRWVIERLQEYKIDYVDLRGVYEKFGYDKLAISPSDRCHPNKLGHELAAREIYNHLVGANQSNP